MRPPELPAVIHSEALELARILKMLVELDPECLAEAFSYERVAETCAQWNAEYWAELNGVND